jgi:hypothetical protein
MRGLARFGFLPAAIVAIALHADGAWAQKSLGDLQKEMNTATGNAEAATKEAKDAMPAKAAKDTEDELDAAVRKNEETLASNKAEKQKTNKAEKDAQDAADTAAKNDPNAKTYRAALKKRRDVRKSLKTICAQIGDIVQRRRKNLGPEAVKEADDVYKKCLETLNDTAKVITAALFDDGPSPGLQQGQEYVSRPPQNDDQSSPVCYSWDCSSQLTTSRPRNNPPRPCYSWDCSIDPLANPDKDPNGSGEGPNKIIPYVPILPVQPQGGSGGRF